ncbi:MAG: protein kinase [Pseudomonadota bacterium]
MAYQHTLSKGTVLNAEYRIERVLGSGGFANTYLARDLTLNRDVAIKEYFPSDISIRVGGSSVRVKAASYESHFKWGLERFVREAKTLAKFRHPNIVRVFRTFDANETAYTVLDFVKGADMEAWLKELGRTPSQVELDQILSPILDALGLVHDAGILHRDIKPANIYIRSEDQQPVLLDFGAARYAVGELTGTTAAIVSRGYSPHEAYATDNKLQGPWTDIYGLAATIHRALSGKEPTESTLRVLEDALVPASQLKLADPTFRENFLHSIDWGLSVLPNNRPRSVEEWRAELFQGVSSTSGPVSGARSGPNSGRNAGPSTSETPSGQRFSHPRTSRRKSNQSGPRPPSGPPSAGRTPSGRPTGERPSAGNWGLPPGAEEPSRPKPSQLRSQTEARRTKSQASKGMMAAAAIALIGIGGVGAWQSGLIGGSGGGSDKAASELAALEKTNRINAAQERAKREAAAAAEARAREAEAKEAREREQLRLRREAEAARQLAETRARERAEREAAARRAEEQRLAALAEQRRIAEEQEALELAQLKAKEEAERRRLLAEQQEREEADRRLRARQREALRQENLARERRLAEQRAKEAAEREAAARAKQEATRLAMLARERELEAEKAEEARKAKAAREAAARAEAERRASEEAAAAQQARERAEAARAKAEAEAELARQRAKADAEERARLAALTKQPDDEQRTVWVREIQTQLKSSQCYDGEIDGATDTAQNSLKSFEAAVVNGSETGGYQPIKLASANVGEFNSWFKWFRSKRTFKCPLLEDRTGSERTPQTRNRSTPTSKATPKTQPRPKTKRASPKQKPRVKTKTVRSKSSPKPRKKKVYRKKKKSYSASSSGRPDRIGGSR